LTRLLAYLPRGNTLDDRAWQKRHVFLQWVLLLHLPTLFLFGVYRGRTAWDTMVVLSVPAACLVLGRLIKHRRTASVLITAGLTYCSAVLVSFSGGSIEAHFHFFIMIGFIALYQDWVPFLWNVGFTVLSHGIGSAVKTNLIFNHPAGQTSPWVWSAIHGIAVLAACCGVVIFWETTEREQRKTLTLTRQLADAEINRRRFTSDLLVNLARRNQSLLYRQLGLINQLEDQEEDPDALADLFQLDHLATRIRRNAESLLVLSGEEPPRIWGRPVALVDVVRAAIAETEDLDRVVFAVDERLAVFGNAVADLTHLVAELVENAVHFSPPEASVIIRTRPYLQSPGAHVLTVEDWGVGMRPEDMAAANEQLATPRDVDLSVSQRLGLHVVARLAQRHGIDVSLTPTPGCGVTAAVVLPPSLFADAAAPAADDGFGDGEVPTGVVPALAASVTPTPAADLPSAPPPPPASPRWSPPAEQQWVDLTDGAPANRGNGGHAGERAPHRPAAGEPDPYHPAVGEPASYHPAVGEPASYRPAAGEPAPSVLRPGERVGNGAHGGEPAPNGARAEQPVPAGAGDGNGDHLPAGDGGDWSGWWEPSTDELRNGEPTSPIAARPPLSERAQTPFPGTPSSGTPFPGTPSSGTPFPGTPGSGTPEPHPLMPGPPEREGSPMPERAAPAVHSPRAHDPRAYDALAHDALAHDARGHDPRGDDARAYDPLQPAPAPVGVHGPEAGEEANGPTLSRRVPQAHLAPELRRSGQGPAAARPDAPLPDAAEARAALSRYQASRQAARAVVEEGADPERPANGGWS
jgi:signal transduction histidine kinase